MKLAKPMGRCAGRYLVMPWWSQLATLRWISGGSTGACKTGAHGASMVALRLDRLMVDATL